MFASVLARPQQRIMKGRTMKTTYQVWVATRSKSPEHALEGANLIASCHLGPAPRMDAESYARDHTFTTGEETYVFQVEMVIARGYRIHKEVRSFDPTKP